MDQKITKFSITFMAILAAHFSAIADRLPDNTRLSDSLNRTGERFAIVFQNDSEESASVILHGDPNFHSVDPTSNGIINTPQKSTGYKVFYRKILGYPSLVQERGESLENSSGLRITKDVFDGITGIQVNQGIFAEVNHHRCTTIMPDPSELRNLAQFQGESARDLVRMSGIGTNLNLGIVHIVQNASKTSCTATLRVPGDLSFVEDGRSLPGTTANLSDAISVRDVAKNRLDQLIAQANQREYNPVITTGAKDGAMAVRDQAAQLLAQRTQIAQPEVGSKIQWASDNKQWASDQNSSDQTN